MERRKEGGGRWRTVSKAMTTAAPTTNNQKLKEKE